MAEGDVVVHHVYFIIFLLHNFNEIKEREY